MMCITQFIFGEGSRLGCRSARPALNREACGFSKRIVDFTRWCEPRGRGSLRPRRARSPLLNAREFRAPLRAFTLIEIMVVVAIMGIILAAGIPSLYGFFHKSGIRKTMTDVQDTCRSARQKAIISGNPADLVIHPKQGTMEVAGGVDSGYSGWAHSAKFEGTKLQALKINNSHEDLSQADEVHVRFYPNGTCDEMIMIFMSEDNKMTGISLEITTALPYIMTDKDIQGLTR